MCNSRVAKQYAKIQAAYFKGGLYFFGENMKHNKHSNQVRIIGGSYRGSVVHFADSDGLRPTADSVRERLFNWMGQDLTGLTVLDLFAGSGVLGMEAASRGAKIVALNEKNKQVCQQIKSNIERLKLSAIQVTSQDAYAYLAGCQQVFDVVFLDPPYAFADWTALFTKINKVITLNTLVYLEAGQLPMVPENFTVLKQGKSGKSQFVLLEVIALQ